MKTEDIIKYYNKFPEDKRLRTRHGIVEWTVTMRYIEKFLQKIESPKILDVGAGTGAYSVYLAEKGYDVCAIELVKFNLGLLKKKTDKVKAFQGDARSLKRFKDNSFDVVLLFGPMYHLTSTEDKLKALGEARRVVKSGGYIFVAYVMNDYAVLTYGFKEGNIHSIFESGRVDKTFKIIPSETDLYSYVRMEDVEFYSKELHLEREVVFAPDGAADYMRPVLNNMEDKTFKLFIDYQEQNAERKDLLGASSHIVDVLKKP